jgi:hypothetical protein
VSTEKNYIDGDWIYDLETYPSTFTFAISSSDGKHVRVFEVSDRMNQTQEILNCLRYLAKNKQRMIGFNNLGFDYPVLHAIMEQAKEAKCQGIQYYIDANDVYNIAMAQIQTARDGFAKIVKSEDEIIPQIDLFKINHFDNKARMTSLKMLEFNMLSDNIEDLPFPVGKHLTHSEIDVLKHYNLHDVLETKKFYHHNIPAIRLREDLSKKYSYNFMNHNDTKIGKDYFILELEKHQKGICYKVDSYGRRKMNQTKHKSIALKDCLFDYYDFKRPEFIALKDWFAKQTIKETKGVFTDIEEHLLGDVAKYAEMDIKRIKFKAKPTDKEVKDFIKLHPCGWVEEQELKALETLKDSQGNPVKETYIDENTGKEKQRVVRVPKMSYYGCFKVASSLNVVVNGFRLDFGQGGAHASLLSTIVKADDYFKVEDADVSSFYPNMAISNKIYPLHLGETFCTIYKDVYVQRQSFKKGTSENAIMKLALNGVFGDSGSEFSPFFDSSFLLKITINGQLSLCLLAERLLEIPELQIIQVNTDGITVKYPRKYEEKYYKVCDDWQKHVKLELEYADYESMHIANVNNYIAKYTNGKIKLKGAYVADELGWHQNHSAKVIQMAASSEMLDGIPVEEFIRNHKNKYDFLLRTKVPRSSSLVLLTQIDDEGLEFEETKLQNICRYYACKEGGKLVKVMPPLEGSTEFRRIGIDTEWNVKTCNNIEAFRWDVDYDYYITEAKKLVIEEK